MNIVDKFKILFFKKEQTQLINMLVGSPAYEHYKIAQNKIESNFKELIIKINKKLDSDASEGMKSTWYDIGYNVYKDKDKKQFLKNYYMEKGYIVKFKCSASAYENIYYICLIYNYDNVKGV